MGRRSLRFAAVFIACIAAFSAALQIEAVERSFVIPFTRLIAHAGSAVLNLIGLPTRVEGTVISGEGGFGVNILKGCNGVYVTAIVVSAILAFPSTWREKTIGLALSLPGVQAVNLVRIVSLYYIGLTREELFEQFHLYVWQTGVIILSMAIWLFWAEVLVRPEPTRR